MTQSQLLETRVQQAYSDLARDPSAPAPFVCGRELAEDVGYPSSLLDSLPASSVEAFCGLSNLSLQADLQKDQVVLDLGCGAGLDCLVACRKAQRVYAVDFSADMLQRARLALADRANVVLLQASAQKLPLLPCSVDVALVNGLFNLNPARAEVFAELARVLRPGGSVYAAEIVLTEPLPESMKDPAHWFA